MCLSTVYRNRQDDAHRICRNVRAIRIDKEEVVMTDIMEREIRCEGKIIKADLINGVVIVGDEL